MTVILPASDLVDAPRLFRLSKDGPVYIDAGGNDVRVVMSADIFEKLAEAALDRDLQESYRKAVEEGGWMDAHEFLEGLRNERL